MKRALEEDQTAEEVAATEGSSSSSSSQQVPTSNTNLANGTNLTANSNEVEESGARWQPFYLFSNRGVEAKHNQNCITTKDLFHQEPDNLIKQVLITNFMVDLLWLGTELPHLKDLDTLILHGSWSVDRQNSQPAWTVSRAENKEKFGTHYCKLCLIFYEKGLRVVIHTANLVPDDVKFRTQGAFVQDFPLKADPRQSHRTRFEEDLVDFLDHYQLESSVKQKLNDLTHKVSDYDFSSADVVLVASTPGKHREIKRWGVGKLRDELYRAGLLDDRHSSGRLALSTGAFGSMGRDAWLVEDYLRRLMLEYQPRGRDPYDVRTQADLIWPTLEWIKASHQGYASGSALPCSERNLLDMDNNPNQLLKGFKGLLRTYDASPVGRTRNPPQVKCIFRYQPLKAEKCIKDPTNPVEDDNNVQELNWFFMTSANFNQNSIGQYVSGESYLCFKSYEIGVLFIPKRTTTIERIFSCTPSHPLLGMTYGDFKEVTYARFTNESRASYFNKDVAHVCFPIPFKVPAKEYDFEVDFPWVYDRHFRDPDCLGYVRIVAQPN